MKINLKEKLRLERDCRGITVDKSVCLREWGTGCKTCKNNPNYYSSGYQVVVGILLIIVAVPIYIQLLINFVA